MFSRKTLLEKILMSSFDEEQQGVDFLYENDISIESEVIGLTNPDQHAEFGNNNHRYQQPTEQEIIYFINSGVKNFIRLNGEASGHNPMSKDEEKKIVEENGANFYFIYPESGYVAGKGYADSISKVLSILSEGNSMIHCSWGADRTGFMVAAYLKEYEGKSPDWLWNYTTKYNSWEDKNNKLICSKSNRKYAKYLDGFYPLDRWCEKYADNSCYNCSKKSLKKYGFDIIEDEENTNS